MRSEVTECTHLLLWVELSEEDGRKWTEGVGQCLMNCQPWKPLPCSSMQMSSFLNGASLELTSPEMATIAFDSFQTAGYHPLVTHENIVSEEAFSRLRGCLCRSKHILATTGSRMFLELHNCIKHFAPIMAEMKGKRTRHQNICNNSTIGKPTLLYLKYNEYDIDSIKGNVCEKTASYSASKYYKQIVSLKDTFNIQE